MPAFTSVQQIFENMCQGFRADKAVGDKAVIQFDFSGDGGGKYWVKVAEGTCAAGSGAAPENVDMTLLSTADDWVKISNGELNPMTAFMQGKVKVQGNMGLAMKLQTWFAM
ncbi:MAG: SCP2 sterol-binding domain-containing protein [Anaerolineae bacterium]|nr:SCP2 sterol-binding domain-containing protein [Anaerolineae bacterium]